MNASRPAEPILEVRDVTVRYGRHPGIQNVSFSVMPGEQVAVVGPNGAGKSTLFKAVAGILPVDEGSIRVHGHRPGRDLCVAYVQQRSEVDWAFPVTVADVVMMGRTGQIGLFKRPSAEDRAAVDAALEAVELHALADRQIGQLSGGQQQRMFIARALAQEAELVLLDEPMAGLDIMFQAEILAVLDTLRSQSVSVMVATHDLELAAERFDRTLLLNRRLVAVGTPDEVLTEGHLREVYHGTIRLIETEHGYVVLGDTCCGGETHAANHRGHHPVGPGARPT